jgi:hypothetical protein
MDTQTATGCRIKALEVVVAHRRDARHGDVDPLGENAKSFAVTVHSCSCGAFAATTWTADHEHTRIATGRRSAAIPRVLMRSAQNPTPSWN